MNTILTDDELPPLQPQDHPEPHSMRWSDAELRAIRARDRLVEAAVLAKLREQEPVAYGMPDTQLGRKHRLMMVRLDKGQDGCTLPLYAAPLPAVVQEPKGVDVEGRRIAAEAENHACSLAVWMTRMDAESPDADDLGVSGWLQEAEERIKRRMLAAAPEAPAQEKSNG